MMPDETYLPPGGHDDTGPLDLLDRQPFIDQLIAVVETLAESRRNACYAINGSWGVGKSYVLDRFEKQIARYHTEGTTLSKYLVFHYNCWQYDYYAEPLVAIIAAILDAIDENVKVLSLQNRERAAQALRLIAASLTAHMGEKVKKHTGVDLEDFVDTIRSAEASAKKETKEKRSFDSHLNFKKTVKGLQQTIEDLASEQTILLIVDELDRCLPEYAIKVLERLHHVFDGISNVQVILSIDKGQLEHTVQQIYGPGTSTEKYLEKFIQFQIKLDEGTLNDQFNVKFKAYIERFSAPPGGDGRTNEAGEVLPLLLDGIDIRTRIAVIEKCRLVHEILERTYSVRLDSGYMYLEIFLVLLKYYGLDPAEVFQRTSSSGPLRLDARAVLPPPIQRLNSMFMDNKSADGYSYWASQAGSVHIYTGDIPGLLLACYRCLGGCMSDQWNRCRYRQTEVKRYLEKYWDMLQVIC